MKDMSELLKQARVMQEQFQRAQEEALKETVEGQAGAGMVRIQMNGRHDVLRVTLADELMTEDKSVIEDLIGAACNDAARKLEDKARQRLASMGAGLTLPEGFKFPF